MQAVGIDDPAGYSPDAMGDRARRRDRGPRAERGRRTRNRARQRGARPRRGDARPADGRELHVRDPRRPAHADPRALGREPARGGTAAWLAGAADRRSARGRGGPGRRKRRRRARLRRSGRRASGCRSASRRSTAGVSLADADVVVSGGRGVGSADGLRRDRGAGGAARRRGRLLARGDERRAGGPTPTRSGRREPRSHPRCTSRAGSAAPRSTWPGARAPRS